MLDYSLSWKALEELGKGIPRRSFVVRKLQFLFTYLTYTIIMKRLNKIHKIIRMDSYVIGVIVLINQSDELKFAFLNKCINYFSDFRLYVSCINY